MNVRTVDLDTLRQIARDGRHHITVDATRRIAYLRRGQVRYVAQLDAA